MADWVAPDPAPPAGTHGQQDRMAQKRVRVSLRLDSDRHARLKLVATQRNCTLQSLFTEAIDEFFVRHAPDLHGISAHLRRGTLTTCTATPGTATPGTASPGTASTASEGKIGLGKHNSEGRNGPSRSR
jgi:predicted DNA-binding ribbon-helix-helix protein